MAFVWGLRCISVANRFSIVDLMSLNVRLGHGILG
jgi:hypothetical protein